MQDPTHLGAVAFSFYCRVCIRSNTRFLLLSTWRCVASILRGVHSYSLQSVEYQAWRAAVETQRCSSYLFLSTKINRPSRSSASSVPADEPCRSFCLCGYETVPFGCLRSVSIGLQPRGDGRAAKSLFLRSRHLSAQIRCIVMVNAMCAAISPSDLTSLAIFIPRSTYVLTQPCFRMLMDNITSRLSCGRWLCNPFVAMLT